MLGNTNIQIVDYTYNSRDWLTAINNVDNIGGDKFAEALHYFDGGLGSTAQYNGNIAAARFYNAGVGSAPYIGYRFAYDGASRLTSAQTYTYSGGWVTTNNYRVSPIVYDPNGNILNLTRLSQTGTAMDDLSYTYQAGTNKLTSVFNSVGSVTQTYTYDANGNALTDSYRGISGSTYDIHNLPISQTHSNGTISYWYDANGNRVRKQQGGTDHYYFAGQDGTTEAVYNASGSLRSWNITANGQLIGKVVPGSPLTRYYYLKDHLGSIRVTVKEDNTIAGWDDYYPYGMIMAGRSGNSGQADTKYRFISKERDAETGYDWLDARGYDARIGRFLAVDPLADKVSLVSWSTYHYSFNNPIRFIDPSGMEGEDNNRKKGQDVKDGVKITNISVVNKKGESSTVTVKFKNTKDGASSDNKVDSGLKTAVEGAVKGAAETTEISEITITATTNGVHGENSRHYSGKALDIGEINGKSVGSIGSAGPVKALQEAFEKQEGARENFGPSTNKKSGKNIEDKSIINNHKNHIHFSVD